MVSTTLEDVQGAVKGSRGWVFTYLLLWLVAGIVGGLQSINKTGAVSVSMVISFSAIVLGINDFMELGAEEKAMSIKFYAREMQIRVKNMVRMSWIHSIIYTIFWSFSTVFCLTSDKGRENTIDPLNMRCLGTEASSGGTFLQFLMLGFVLVSVPIVRLGTATIITEARKATKEDLAV